MNIIKVNTKVSAPQEVEVHLVRGDLYETSNIFRTCFEVSLAITATLFGVVLTLSDPVMVYILFLILMFLASIAFLILTWVYKKKAFKK